MLIRISEATERQLDWITAKCEGVKWNSLWKMFSVPDTQNAALSVKFEPSTDWSQGGPIIEREQISVNCEDDGPWSAMHRDRLFYEDGTDHYQTGPTPLIAAMRCYVASKLGDEIDVPDELTKETE